MIDGGVVGLYVGAQYEAVGGKPCLHLPHGRFGAAMAYDMRAARRHGQDRPQHDAQGFQDQHIASGPNLDFAAIGFANAIQKTEPELPGREISFQAALFVGPISAKILDISAGRVIASGTAQPRIGAIQQVVGQ
jgi:hypothetical protein